jgi:drug/metabolite transporter (DMT)-like permease
MMSGHVALFFGLVAVSTSAPFFVMAKVDAYAAVFWRTILGGTLALLFAAARGNISFAALRQHARGVVLGGLLLGIHFLLWIKAFDLTDYASNLLLLVAQPILGALLGRVLGEPLPRRAWLAILLSFLGMLLIAGADVTLGPQALLGDLFAIIASGLIAVFYVVAREARVALPLETFMGSTLLVASATALPVALLADTTLTGLSASSWGWICAIVAITTLSGHGLINLAARSVPLFTLNLVIVLEPPISIGIGALLFGATVNATQLFGGVFLTAAVIVGLQSAAASKNSQIGREQTNDAIA